MLMGAGPLALCLSRLGPPCGSGDSKFAAAQDVLAAEDGVVACTSDAACTCLACSARAAASLKAGGGDLSSPRPPNSAPSILESPCQEASEPSLRDEGDDASAVQDPGKLIRAKAKLILLPKAMAALRRFQRTIAERALKKQADAVEVERGVLVERVFDFYDPMTKTQRLRRMNSENIHTRKQKKPNLGGNAGLEDSGVSNNSDDEDFASDVSQKKEQRPEPLSCDSDNESVSSSSSVRPTTTTPSSHKKKAKEFVSVVTHDQAEIIAMWGVLVGKILKAKVLNFTCVTDAAVMKRKLEVGTGGADRVMQSVRSRAVMVVQQMRSLMRKVAKEPIDILDKEWEDASLLSELFSSEYVDTLCLIISAAGKIISAQPACVNSTVPCRIFGDTHGQLRDVLMLFNAFGAPSAESDVSFVFNGDFVDRGKHQLALVGLLFALKVALPDKIVLVRGNHEEKSMNLKYGFQAELVALLGREFGDKILTLVHKVFDVLPLGCVVSEKILVVHGGLGDARWGLQQLMAIRRPLTHEELMLEENDWINAILWSDPIEDDDDDSGNQVFGVHASPRGKVAKTFGWDVTKVFCARNGLSLVVRSHQSKRGSPGFDVMHDNLLMRVFSARDYEGHSNDGAVLFVRKCEGVKLEASGDDDARCGADKDLMWVRPQVLRSTMKARKDLIRNSDEPGAEKLLRLGRAVPPRSSAQRRPRPEAEASSGRRPVSSPMASTSTADSMGSAKSASAEDGGARRDEAARPASAKPKPGPKRPSVPEANRARR